MGKIGSLLSAMVEKLAAEDPDASINVVIVPASIEVADVIVKALRTIGVDSSITASGDIHCSLPVSQMPRITELPEVSVVRQERIHRMH